MSDGLDVFALALKITTDGAEQAESALERIDEKGQALGGSFKSLAGVVGGAIAAFVALEKAMEFISSAVGAGAEEEQTFVRMGVAVQNAGESFNQAKPAISALLEELSEHSTYQVDQLGQAFTRLVQLTGNVGKSMNAMAIVTDFAAGRNLDLESAANLVGRALNGNATQLNRMLGLHGSASEAIAILTERYKDNASALADTMGGAQSQAQNAMHELMETIGSIIAEEGGLHDATLAWRDILKDVTTWVKAHREEIGNLVLGVISLGRAIGEVISDAIVPLEGAWIAANAIMYLVIATVENIGPTFKLMAATVMLEAASFVSTLADVVPGLHNLLDGVLKRVTTSAMSMAKDAQAAIDANTNAMYESIGALQEGDEATVTATTHVKEHTTATEADVSALVAEGEQLAKLAAMRVLSGDQFVREEVLYSQLTALVNSHKLALEDEVKVRETLQKMQQATPALLGPAVMGLDGGTSSDAEQARLEKKITDGIIATGKAAEKAQKQAATAYEHSAAGEWMRASEGLADSIQNAIRDDFIAVSSDLAGTIADTLGAAFSGGFSSAGKVALQGLGNILSQMGKHMLIAGAALVGLLPALHNPFTSGAAMLAAGAILVAAGAVLGSIATGSGGSGGGGGGGYSVAGAGTATNAAQITNITLSPNASGAASQNKPITMIQPVFIGPNDPTIHGPIIDLINTATGRGYVLTP